MARDIELGARRVVGERLLPPICVVRFGNDRNGIRPLQVPDEAILETGCVDRPIPVDRNRITGAKKPMDARVVLERRKRTVCGEYTLTDDPLERVLRQLVGKTLRLKVIELDRQHNRLILSERVAKLAVAVGRELGIHEPQLLELEYAALMHDIGQLSLRDPISGGATIFVSRQDQQRIAELGADVIQQAQVLGAVAETVRRQNEPYRDIDFVPDGYVTRASGAEPPGPPGRTRSGPIRRGTRPTRRTSPPAGATG